MSKSSALIFRAPVQLGTSLIQLKLVHYQMFHRLPIFRVHFYNVLIFSLIALYLLHLRPSDNKQLRFLKLCIGVLTVNKEPFTANKLLYVQVNFRGKDCNLKKLIINCRKAAFLFSLSFPNEVFLRGKILRLSLKNLHFLG
jgi:hypothetical protein